SYADDKKRPALLETNLDHKKLRGRVLLFTTPLDDLHSAPRNWAQRWHDYAEGKSFYLVLAQLTVGYLAGDAEEGNFNFLCGQTVPVALPPPRAPTYTLKGPGLTTTEAIMTPAPNETELNITRAVLPANYE